MEHYKNLDLSDIIYVNNEGIECVEQWKDVPEYEGIYQVSDLGRVKSLKGKLSKEPYILKQSAPIHSKRKYLCLNLYKKGNCIFNAEILVAMAFLGHVRCGFKLVVDHINNIKTDNRLENLQLISHRENCSKDKKNKTSKYTGVSWCKRRNIWVCYVKIDNSNYNLGRFNKEIYAYNAYKKAVFDWETSKIKPKIKSKKGTNKYVGICFNGKNSWIANFTLNGKRIYVGSFKTEEDAYKKQQEEKQRLMKL